MNPIEISIKDHRAVKSAEIDLNGVSVISGINGSGKSSIRCKIWSFYMMMRFRKAFTTSKNKER